MSRGAKPRRRSGPERILIVDGYNVLNVRRHLEGAAALADAREKLLAELQDYAGYSGQKVILVFDAWQGDRQTRSVEEYGPVQVVFTRKGEIADHYIERLCDGYAEDVEFRRAEVRVATSDALEQTIVLGRGATRISSRELLLEMSQARSAGTAAAVPKRTGGSTVGDRIPPHVLEKLRRIGK